MDTKKKKQPRQTHYLSDETGLEVKRHIQFARIHFRFKFLRLCTAAGNLQWSIKGIFLWRELS